MVGHVQCLILLRVDDVLFIGSLKWKAAFPRSIKEYEHGTIDQLPPDTPIAYCGMKISQTLDRIIRLSQGDFYRKLAPLDPSSIFKGGRFIINEAKQRKLARSFSGGCLWLVQCRYDICFPACQLASDVIDAIRCPGKMKKFIVDSRLVLSRITKHRDICFRNFLNASASCPIRK